MRTLGKLLQVIGLVMLPAAMMMQLTSGIRANTGGGFSVSGMLLMMIFGAGLFMGAEPGRGPGDSPTTARLKVPVPGCLHAWKPLSWRR
jgi:hypothetical protein